MSDGINDPKNKPQVQHEYLGDGAYATWTGYSFELKANSHDNPTDVVVLDEYAFNAFIAFAKRIGALK